MPRHPDQRRAEADVGVGCAKHPLDVAVAVCQRCERRCCEACVLEVRDRLLCIDCGIELSGVSARRRRRRRFLSF